MYFWLVYTNENNKIKPYDKTNKPKHTPDDIPSSESLTKLI